MHVTMIKKRLADGSECRKCGEATAYLQSRGLWDRVDEVVWAVEDDPASPGMTLAAEFGVPQAPFFVVRTGGPASVYTSVLQLVREALGSDAEPMRDVAMLDPDDIGGI